MLLTSRTTKPKYSAGVVDRPRLYRQLDRWQTVRGIAIHAPAGYGKSSLVSRWLELSDLAGQSAWVTLDEGLADPFQFVYALAVALEGVLPGAPALVRPILEDRQGSAERALTRLLGALAESTTPQANGQPVLLVLDDLQRAQSPAIDALILTMLEHGPDTLHLILLARRRTTLALARLYAHEQIATLTADDLRLTPDEISTYLQLHGFSLPSEPDVAQLAQRCEGWVTGLKLAVLSLRRPGNLSELIGALQGDRAWLAAFLVDEVLDRQTPELREFLLQTSILDEFNTSLCAAVTGDAASYAHLAALVHADLFLIRLDENEGWHRYHHLFQELLQHRLKSEIDPEHLADLHRRAAAWLADAGRVHAAVRHLLAAGDEDTAAELVEKRMRLIRVQAPYEARRLIDRLPEALISSRPRLMLDRAFQAMLVDDRELSAMVQKVGKTLEEQDVRIQNAPALYSEWLLLNSAVCFQQGDLAATGRHLAQAERYIDAMPEHIAGSVEFLQMHLAHHEGKHELASQHAAHALDAYSQADFALGTVAVQRELARWSMRRGKSAEATRRFQELFDGWRRERFLLTRETTLACFFAAENSYLQNQLEQASTHQKSMLALATQLQDQELIVAARFLEIFLNAMAGEADVPTSESAVWSAQVTSQVMEAHLVFFRTRIFIAMGRSDPAWHSLQPLKNELSIQSTAPIRIPLIISLYIYVARGVDLDLISQMLANAVDRAEQTNERLYQLHLLALTAWQQVKMVGAEAATPALAEAMLLAQETGYVRVLLDVPDLARLLPGVNNSYAAASPHNGHYLVAVTDAPGLTARERNVLRLLDADYTYRQIAKELVISLNTVRTHVRHIYKKLGVRRRDQAVASAREYGILPPKPGSAQIV